MNSCHNQSGVNTPLNDSEQTLIALSREARRLHKLAVAPSKIKALPVLRRLINSDVFNHISLVQLYQQQQNIQRKHLLNLLAKEMGYGNWGLLRSALEHSEVNVDQHSSLELQGMGYPNLWFSNLDQAHEYISSHGGKAVEVGTQAVVVPNN